MNICAQKRVHALTHTVWVYSEIFQGGIVTGATAKSTVTVSPTATTTTASTSSSPRSPSQGFEVGDMIRVKGTKDDKGGGVVKWVGTLPGVMGLWLDLKIKSICVFVLHPTFVQFALGRVRGSEILFVC